MYDHTHTIPTNLTLADLFINASIYHKTGHHKFFLVGDGGV